MNIKILVGQIIGLAAAGSTEYVATPMGGRARMTKDEERVLPVD